MKRVGHVVYAKRYEECTQNFGQSTLREELTFKWEENIGNDLKDRGIQNDIYLAQGRILWSVLVNVVRSDTARAESFFITRVYGV